jgi:hypothetical protein
MVVAITLPLHGHHGAIILHLLVKAVVRFILALLNQMAVVSVC